MELFKYLVHKKAGGDPPEPGVLMKPKPKATTHERPLMGTMRLDLALDLNHELVRLAEAINWVSGGNEYVAGAFSPTPDQIDYLIAQLGGGVAREAAKVQQTVSSTLSGEELPTYKVPLVGRFVGNAASQASQASAFYANLNRLNELETEIKGLRKDGRFDEAAKLARENPQSMMIAMANRAERDVQRLRREKRELIANDASREQVRAKEDQITAVMTRLNEAAARRLAPA